MANHDGNVGQQISNSLLLIASTPDNLNTVRQVMAELDPRGLFVREVPMSINLGQPTGMISEGAEHGGRPTMGAAQVLTSLGPIKKICVTCGATFGSSSALASHCNKFQHGNYCPYLTTRINELNEWRRHISLCLNH